MKFFFNSFVVLFSKQRTNIIIKRIEIILRLLLFVFIVVEKGGKVEGGGCGREIFFFV